MELDIPMLLLTTVVILCACEELCFDTYVNLVQGYNNKRIIDLNTVQWTTNLSLAMCLEKCYQDYLCLSVNVAPDTNTCVGFKQKFEGRTSETETVQGYRVYETVKTLSANCSTADHCSTYFGQSFCNDNQCQCDIGYSLDGFHCRTLTECTSFSDVMNEYPGKFIESHNIQTYSSGTLALCGSLCLYYTQCQSADFQLSTGRCVLKDTTWFGADVDDRGISFDYIYNQRECNW